MHACIHTYHDNHYKHTNIHTYGGCTTKTLPGDPPPIAGQSRYNRDPTGPNRGATLGIAAVSVSSFAILSQALAFSHITGNKKEVTWLGWAAAHWWNSSNRRPIASFQPLPASRFGKHCPARHKRKQYSGTKGTFAQARSVEISETCVGTMHRLSS